MRSAVFVGQGRRVFAFQILDLLDLLANCEIVVAATTGRGAGEQAVGGAVVEQTAAGRRCGATAGADADVRVVVLGLTVVAALRTNTGGAGGAVGAVALYGQRVQWQRTPETGKEKEIKYTEPHM